MSVEADTTSGDDSPAPERGPISSLFKSLSNLLATFVAIAHTRLELLTTELQEEMHNIAEILMWSLVALLAAGIGLFLAALVLRSKVKNRAPLLENTLAELAKDRKQLERRL